MSDRYTALFTDIHNLSVLVIGGGNVALRKCRYLSNAKITVISEQILPEMESVAHEIILRSYSDEDLDPEKYDMVVAATNVKELNDSIRDKAMKCGLRVNSAHGGGDVLIPSVLERENYTVAVSSGGRVPAFPPFVISKLDDFLDDGYDALMAVLTDLRAISKEKIDNQPARRKFLEDVLKDALFIEYVWNNDIEKAKSRALSIGGIEC